MGILESVRGVLWARKRQPGEVAYGVALGSERFDPSSLVEQAIAAEHAGFEAVCTSDHLAPWWDPATGPPAACGNAWVWLGAAGQATQRVSLGSAVTAVVHRYNPVVVAQQVATLEALNPGRAFLGVGSGEAMNEVPAGMQWPPVGEQLARTEEALNIIKRLLDGETVDFQGRYFQTTAARLYLDVQRRPPVYMSAFGPEAAEIAGRLADGLWTLADPQQAPGVIAAYRRSAEQADREPGEIILQGMASWAEDDETALGSAREWKGTLVDQHYTDPVSDPAGIRAGGEEISDTKFKAMGLIGSDPEQHARKIKAMQSLGASDRDHEHLGQGPARHAPHLRRPRASAVARGLGHRLRGTREALTGRTPMHPEKVLHQELARFRLAPSGSPATTNVERSRTSRWLKTTFRTKSDRFWAVTAPAT